MKNSNWLAIVMLLVLVSTPAILQAAHPFLIVTEANYTQLQSRSATSPWSTMKTQACSDCKTLVFSTSTDYATQTHQMDDIASACTLAYILDTNTANRTTYLNKFYNTAMTAWPTYLRPGLNAGSFTYTVLPGISYFSSVLALDIMYNGLDSTQRSNIETEFQLVANWYNSANTSWELNLYACRGIWALYINDRTKIDLAKAGYRDELFNEETTTDGVANMGPGYAGVRLSQERESKGNFMDVLDFTGEDPYYTDPNAINLMEWLYGYGTTPFREDYTFGDSAPNRSYHERGASTFRAHRFSDKAGRYAAWINNGLAPYGRLLHYVLMDQPLMSQERGPSRIFPDGGAWFVEAGLNTRALSAALWNPMSYESHSHKDVSAVHMAAYGEHVIRNSGYAGWGLPDSSSWTYIHDQAYSNSTALINYTDHAQKYGNGIVEGFVAPNLGFDYACSDSGPAISNGSHYRNLLFIHPSADANGYWILFDEFDATSSTQANILLHPNASAMSVITTDIEYRSKISDLTFSGHTVYISMFLGTTPTSISMNDGILAQMDNAYFTGKYLRSNYNTDANGVKNVVTVLYPSDSTHTKATMARITGTGYTGASITQVIVDIALESAGTSTITYSGVSFRGLATWYRKSSGLVTSYFVRKGLTFNNGVSPRVGFDSTGNISLYMNKMQGRIVSLGANVTFYYHDVNRVLLNGSPLSIISSGVDWVQVYIPSGTHEVELDLNAADINEDGDVDFKDFAILASQWLKVPGIPSADIAPPGGDNFVNFLDLNEFADNWLDGAAP